MALDVILVSEKLVLVPVRWEDGVASSDKEEPLRFSALGDEEATSTLSPRCRLCTDRETERGGERIADFRSGIVPGAKCEELGTR